MDKLEPEAEERIRTFLERLADGTVCVHCGKPVEQFIQVGRSYYASPCQHRQGQGQATYFNKKIAEKREVSQ
jgi:hypothetical protein